MTDAAPGRDSHRRPTRLLAVTAVPPERDALAAGLPTAGPLTVDLLVCGVGPAAAAARTATALATQDRYDLVLSAGIGGGFASVAEIGQVVVATELVAADLGTQLPTEFTDAGTAPGFASVSELGFGVDRHQPPAALSRALADAASAVYAPVLTVSTATGTAERAAELLRRHPGAAAEAMEGFGVAEAAAQHGVPVLELRAVSNAVGLRDRSSWRIPAALTALTTAVEQLAPVLAGWRRP